MGIKTTTILAKALIQAFIKKKKGKIQKQNVEKRPKPMKKSPIQSTAPPPVKRTSPLSYSSGAAVARRLNVKKRPFAISPFKGSSRNFGTCQFLRGEALNRDFCGEPVVKGSYCREHYELCHTRGGSDFWKKERHWRPKS